MGVQNALSLFILLVFIGINLWLSLTRLITRITGKLVRRVLRVELPENEKKAIERLFTPIWIGVGLYGAWKVRWDYLAMLFAFLAFRSGANVSKLLVYSHHDGKILKNLRGRLLGTLARVTRLGLLLEGTFILALALAYKTLSALSTSRGPVGIFILKLWLLGLLSGFVFGWFVARNNGGILLRDQIALVLLFAGKKGVEKTEEKVELIKSKKNSLASRFKK
ncbi:conserved membrane protein of unknown function [Thermococcus nautili]|nr:hypothetical protein [Thermococcus nautili]CAI1492517.1 conserved membrane protein of unknown function [Thermococcus nautili]